MSQVPIHGAMSPVAWAIEMVSLVLASVLLVLNLGRLYQAAWQSPWLVAFVLLLALLIADFVSGLVHWFADTWGTETMPILGSRFLRPFRVHHINPHDLCDRSFVDANGDVAMLSVPFLIGALFIPLATSVGQLFALGLVAFVAFSLPTNQIHKWAHLPNPATPVRWLQSARLILNPGNHARHHAEPHTTNYCITLGWCNAPLNAIEFFPRLERILTRLTGIEPRSDVRDVIISKPQANS